MNKLNVKLRNKRTNAERTVEVTGASHTQKSAESHVAKQYGSNAAGRNAHLAKEWEVVPADEPEPSVTKDDIVPMTTNAPAAVAAAADAKAGRK